MQVAVVELVILLFFFPWVEAGEVFAIRNLFLVLVLGVVFFRCFYSPSSFKESPLYLFRFRFTEISISSSGSCCIWRLVFSWCY